MNNHHQSETRFESLDLPTSLMQGITDTGFTHCTPIQALSLPIALQGHDVAGQAQTGTGKTAAFLLATYNHLLIHPPLAARKPTQPRALILAPTRELAIQIHKDALTLGKHSGLKLGLAYGGTDYEKQRRILEDGVDILIGTPGRIIDYFKSRVFNLKAIQVTVMDEADRMFDLGFIKDIRYLLRQMPDPTQRLNMLFSATLSHRVTELAYEHMNSPEEIKVESEQITAENVKQVVYYTANEEKMPLLIGLLRHMDPYRTIIFANTKRVTERIDAFLEGNGFEAAVLSGDVPQKKRQYLLERFQQGDLPILVATDVAARGLHIPEVSHIFNFDLPQDAEDYVHRIGRTARAGASGDAISFACEDYSFGLPDIEAFIGHSITSEPVSSEFLADLKPPARRVRPPRQNRHGGNRHSGPHRGGDQRGSGKRHARPPKQGR